MNNTTNGNKIVSMMLIVISAMLNKWTETIGPRLGMVGSSFYDEGLSPIPEKFRSPENRSYTSDDVYELHSYFSETIHIGIGLANMYYSQTDINQVLAKFEYLDSIKAAKEVIDDIMKSPMMDKLLVAERQAAVAARTSRNS